MADFKCSEMASVDGRCFNGTKTVVIDGLGREAVGRRRSTWRGYHLGIACAIALMTASLLMSAGCLWSQRKLEVENYVLKEDVEILETKILTVEEKLSETFVSGRSEASSVFEPESHQNIHSRLRRSNSEASRDRRRTKNSKAVHFRLDVGDGSTSNELKWRIWNGPDSTSASQFFLETVRLSDDRKSVVVSEPGLYFIYAQIHFENARPRNAFAVKVDDDIITKCFQSLDYFNHSLTSTENSRLKSCYSASTVVLGRNQVVSLANLYPSHRIFNDPKANYWGIVKLADA